MSHRIVVVSYLAGDVQSPRGARTNALLKVLEQELPVEVVAGARPGGNSRLASSPARRLAGRAVNTVLIDRFEPWSRRRFRRWSPKVDGALLVGYPFSPLVFASSRLREQGTPYVVDLGDPFALTASRPTMRGLALLRARRAEARMWAQAAGAVVTTPSQCRSLQILYPRLPILVRPNGVESDAYRHVAHPRSHSARGDVLSLVHFGSIYESRLDIRPFVRRLVATGPWSRIELAQFGPDWTGGLADLGPSVALHVHDAIPWAEAIRRARDFDAALVIGNLDPSQLPSKAVSYLGLPIPRIAITSDPERDAMGGYLRGKTGWVVVRPDNPDAPLLIERHLSRTWSVAELAPPGSESWDAVAREIADFVLRTLGISRSKSALGSGRRAS